MKRVIILFFTVLVGILFPSLISQEAYSQSVYFTSSKIRYTLKDGGVISCKGDPDIGKWERCPDDKNVLLCYVGYPGADGVDGCIIKNNRIYFITAGSETFELKYYPNTNTMAAIWWNDEVESGHPSKFRSATVYGNIKGLKDESEMMPRAYQEAVVKAPEDYSVTPKEEAEEKEDIISDYDTAPEFPGGMSQLMSYLASKIHYPEAAALNDIQGRVKVNFVVNKDGTIGDVKVIEGVDPDLDKEAIRVVKRMPNWIPGRKDGKPVKCYYNVTVTFRLHTTVQ
ncbi:MAG: energy transducer TonB [Muribaculaceae bacterium]|nr:energy transducer TonB [Muribaculaceae bacterium]